MRELDDRLARPGRDIERMAQWWTQATQEARYEALRRATLENTPPLEKLRLAIICAEVAAGQVAEG